MADKAIKNYRQPTKGDIIEYRFAFVRDDDTWYSQWIIGKIIQYNHKTKLAYIIFADGEKTIMQLHKEHYGLSSNKTGGKWWRLTTKPFYFHKDAETDEDWETSDEEAEPKKIVPIKTPRKITPKTPKTPKRNSSQSDNSDTDITIAEVTVETTRARGALVEAEAEEMEADATTPEEVDDVFYDDEEEEEEEVEVPRVVVAHPVVSGNEGGEGAGAVREPGPDMFPGIIGTDEINVFSKLPKTEKDKYAGTWTEATGPDGKYMCANYKNLISPCTTKNFDNVTKLFKSPPGYFVPAKLLMHPYVRAKSMADAKTYLHRKALCCNCKTTYGEGQGHLMIDVRRYTQVCVICKKYASTVKLTNKDAFCGECRKKAADSGSGFTEETLRVAVNLIRELFDVEHFVIAKNKYCGNNSTGEKFFIDLFCSFKYKGVNMYIIIEKDENQHSGKSMEKENQKIIRQTAEIIKNDVKNNVPFKMLAIRYNPNKKYTVSTKEANDTQVQYDDNNYERLVILRQWIIWWLVNADKTRKYLITYAWYSHDKHKMLAERNYPGFGLIYHAPDPTPHSDWRYCVDVSETHKFFDRVNNNRTHVDTVFNGKWWIDQGEADRLPLSVEAYARRV